ncbi:MAG: glycosyltransferase family 2 protein [Lachnospiraceae bacterium]|nr:glycosyltransferase family 2 protein [Lachnospiraceae bacterium]
MCKPLVSIIIPVYNAAPFIRAAVSSILSQDSDAGYEVIFVNDASTDNSLEIIGEFCERENFSFFSSDGHIGPAKARNKGISLAKGRYITFLDADDMWEPEKLSLQLKFMEEKDCAFSFTGYEFADEEGFSIDRIVRVPKEMTYKKALKNTTIFTSTVMFDTEKISKDMIMMPDVESEDTATWWKILRSGYRAYGLNRPLTLYRRSAGTLSSNKKTAVKRIWNLYRNVEGLGFFKSAYCFSFYAVHAVARRL